MKAPAGGPSRRGSVFAILVVLLAIAAGASVQCSVLWENVVRRGLEADLSLRLVRLQRAVDRSIRRTGRPPSTLASLAGGRAGLLARIPQDPIARSVGWKLAPVAGGARVRPAAFGPALDGSEYSRWHARPAGSTWIIVHE